MLPHEFKSSSRHRTALAFGDFVQPLQFFQLLRKPVWVLDDDRLIKPIKCLHNVVNVSYSQRPAPAALDRADTTKCKVCLRPLVRLQLRQRLVHAVLHLEERDLARVLLADAVHSVGGLGCTRSASRHDMRHMDTLDLQQLGSTIGP